MSPNHVRLLTAAEVGALFGVDPKTVTNWAKLGRVRFITTPGGHRRYPNTQFAGVYAVLASIEARTDA